MHKSVQIEQEVTQIKQFFQCSESGTPVLTCINMRDILSLDESDRPWEEAACTAFEFKEVR